MRHLFRSFAIATLTLAGFTAVASAQNAPAPVANQRARIKAGIQDGSLTRAEATRLRLEQQQLQRQVVRNRIDGGGLTRPEAARIRANAKQNSRQIARLRHNGRTR